MTRHAWHLALDLLAVCLRVTNTEQNRSRNLISKRIPTMRLLAACAVVTLAASGCTFSDNLTGQVSRINKSIEQSQDEAILLNVIRASEGAPLSFTQLVVVRGSGTITGAVGATYGGGVPVVFGPNGATVSSNTNFDLGVLESKEFWLGLQTPMKPETLDFFIREGLPREIVFNLYMHSVALSGVNARRVLVNDPNSPTFPEFSAELRWALQQGLTTQIVPKAVQFGPPLSAENASDMKDLVELAKAGLVLRPTSTARGVGYQVESVKAMALMCFDPALASANVKNSVGMQMSCGNLAARTAPMSQEGIPQDGGAAPFTFTKQNGRPRQPGSEVRANIYPRSAFDIFRYLGSLIKTGTRVELVTEEARSLGAGALSQQLFVVEVNSPRADDFISVEYQGATYSVPIQATATIRVLSLLRRLVALSASVNALPASNTVTIAR